MVERHQAVRLENSVSRQNFHAGTIAYPDPARGGASGFLLVKVFERLGITDTMMFKTLHAPLGKFAPYLVVRGEAELASNFQSERNASWPAITERVRERASAYANPAAEAGFS